VILSRTPFAVAALAALALSCGDKKKEAPPQQISAEAASAFGRVRPDGLGGALVLDLDAVRKLGLGQGAGRGLEATNQRILITGASSGFGLGAARTLAARGHRVCAGMRGVDRKNAAKAGQPGDPQEVVDALVALVELSRGKKPLRRSVGKDVEPGVVPIHEACAQVQHHLLTAFKLR
jgi:hypothetical protein